MADRSVRVTLSAQVQGYIDAMDKAAKATRETGSAAEKLAQQREAFNQVGIAALGMGTLAAAGVGLAVAKWADFDAAMSNVQAATMESEANMKLLSDAALEAGGRTVFSAEEAANAIEELAKAGVSTADILNGALDGALDLAAAGGLGVAEAAGIAAVALKTFNLEGDDMAHVADLLAAGAGKAMGDVTDLSSALNQSAMVANATGLSIEETTAALSAFASQGLMGSDAGTSFKAMLQSLTPTSAAAKEAIDKYNLSAYDAQGNFIGMEAFAGKLQAGLKNLSTEQQQSTLKTIFGSDAIRAATVLYAEGADGIGEWIDAVDDQGYAAEQAAARLDNLKGDIEALGGALDTALIKTGSGANDVLRGMVQWVTDAVDAYNDLPAPLQGAALGAGILTAGLGLLTGAAFLSINMMARFKESLLTLGVTTGGARTAMMGLVRFLGGPWGIAMGVAAISIGTLTKIIEEGRAPVSEIGNALKTSADSATALKKAAETSGFEAFWMGDAAAQLKELPRLMDDAREHGTEFWDHVFLGRTNDDIAALGTLNRFNEALAEVAAVDFSNAQRQFSDLASSQSLSRDQMLTLLETMPDYREEVIRQADDMGIAVDSSEFLALALGEVSKEEGTAADATSTAAGALLEQADAATAATDELNLLIDALNEANGVGQDAESKNAKYQQTLADVAETIAEVQKGTEGYSASLDAATVEGSKNRDMFAGLAADSQAAALALFEQEKSTIGADEAAANYRERLVAGREALIAQVTALTGNADAAKALADQIYGIPDEHTTKIMAETALASEQVRRFIAGLPQTFTVFGNVEWGQTAQNASSALNHANGGIHAYANGGMNTYASMMAFANGGTVDTGIYSGGAPIYKFAEPETGWEALISGKAGQESRNRQIWVEAGNRLGATEDLVKGVIASMPAAGMSVHVHAAPGMSEQQLTDRVVREIKGLL